MSQQLIVTHPGSAHFDEMAAISLILAVHADAEFRVERRQPTPSELDDPDVWVVDIGNRHQPEKLNFDHHQSLDSPASLALVAAHLGLTETMSVLPWWSFKDSVDRFGPVRSSQTYHAGDPLVNRSPLEDWLTDFFAAEPLQAIPLLKCLGAHMIGYARRLKSQIDFWRASRRLVIADRPAMIGETRESAGLEEFRALEKDPPDIVISLDRRSEGWRLFRYDGTPVDLSRLSGDPRIAFAHKSGFMAVTRERLPIEDLIPLISKAVVTP